MAVNGFEELDGAGVKLVEGGGGGGSLGGDRFGGKYPLGVLPEGKLPCPDDDPCGGRLSAIVRQFRY